MFKIIEGFKPEKFGLMYNTYIRVIQINSEYLNYSNSENYKVLKYWIIRVLGYYSSLEYINILI